MIRVLLVDDHQLVRQGVRALLLKASDVQIIGEARDGREAIEAVARLNPDVTLMDIEMPHMDGLAATSELVAREPARRVLIVSMRSDEAAVRQAAKSGAKGYLFKNSSREELIAAIRAVYRGEHYCSLNLLPYFDKDRSG